MHLVDFVLASGLLLRSLTHVWNIRRRLNNTCDERHPNLTVNACGKQRCKTPPVEMGRRLRGKYAKIAQDSLRTVFS